VQKSGRVSGTPNFWPTRQGGFLVYMAHGHNVLLDVEEPYSTQTVAAAAIMKPHALRGLANLDT